MKRFLLPLIFNLVAFGEPKRVTSAEETQIRAAEEKRNAADRAVRTAKKEDTTAAQALESAKAEYRRVLAEVESHYPCCVLQPEMLTLSEKPK